jgi:isoleucyl-tRNA synthetase
MRVGLNLDGTERELGADDLLLSMEPLEGYQVEREGSHAVALDLDVDDALRREGWARDVVRAVQNARKGAGLEVSDRIALDLGGDQALIAAAREHASFIAAETLATEVSYDGGGAEMTIDGRPLEVGVRRA